MVGALPRRPSADHSRAGTSTASILAGLRCRAGAPVHAHEVPIAAVVVPAPFSLSPFLGPSLAHPRSLSRVLSHACPLSLSRFSRSLSRVFSTLVLSLSLPSRTRVFHSRVFSLSLSLSSRTRVSPRACSLFLSLSLSPPPLSLSSLSMFLPVDTHTRTGGPECPTNVEIRGRVWGRPLVVRRRGRGTSRIFGLDANHDSDVLILLYWSHLYLSIACIHQ